MGRKKKEIKLKEPVRIREKNLLDGSISLYLDIYYRGNRKKEGLKLYLVPEINATSPTETNFEVGYPFQVFHESFLRYTPCSGE